jgi:Phytanoyl-CoA dioxygenase (PhyH)
MIQREPIRREPIFAGEQLQARFERYGFVVLDFLDAARVEHLKAVALDVAGHHQLPFFSSIFSHDGEYRHQVNAEVCAAFEQPVATYFSNGNQIFGGFMTKLPVPQSFIGFHQDWTVVDETRYDGATIWAALVDVDETNGCLLIVPGSHRLNDKPRGFNSDFPYEPLVPALLRSHTIRVPMRAGQAIVFSHRMFHGSNPNAGGGGMRLCAQGIVTPRDASLYHYRVAGADSPAPGKLEKFGVPRDYYSNTYRFGIRPESRYFLGALEAEYVPVTEEGLPALLPALEPA